MRQLQRILHVEDVRSIQVVTRLALERVGGFDVLACDSGRQALEQVEQFAPDLILLDAMLPEMDGAEILARLSETIDLSGIPVVFLTGAVEPERHRELRALGAADVLVKPFDPLTLPNQLREIWQRSLADSEVL